MRIIITEEQKKKLFIPRKLDGEDSRWSDWNKEQPIIDGKRINQYDSEGRKTGYWEHYHNNGTIYMRGSYENRRRDGVWEWYDVNGKLLYKELYDNGKFIKELTLTESKKLFIPRKLSGEGSRWEQWNKDQPIIDGIKINQYDMEGLKQGYWEDEYDYGEVNGKGNYIKGKKDGYWEYYWDNGGLYKQGSYKDGKKDGIWEEYFKDGEFWYEGEYKNGKYIRDIRI